MRPRISVYLVLVVAIASFPAKGLVNRVSELSGEELLSAHLFQIIEFYKQDDPVGSPIGSVPDPLPIPPVQHSFTLATMRMTNVLTHGVSRLRVRRFHTELSSMSVRTELHLEQLVISGNYTMTYLLSTSSGSFTVTLKDVTTTGNVTLAVDRAGILRTDDIELDVTVGDLSMNFQNAGLMARLSQGLVNFAPNLVYETIKPFLLKEVYSRVQLEIDTRIEQLVDERNIVFANSASPLDLAIAEARKMLRRKGFDPYVIPEYKSTGGIVGVHLTNTWMRGLSSFYRSGDVAVTMTNNTVDLQLMVSTGPLQGFTQWEAFLVRGFLSQFGSVRFTIRHLQVMVRVRQPLDLRRKPELLDLQLEMGSITIQCTGAGTLDYLVEAVVNILPNLLRYQLMDAIEGPLKARIREKLQCMNMEQFVKRHVADFNRRGVNMEIDWRLCERKVDP